MVRTYDTGAAEEKALAYLSELPTGNAARETPDQIFARLVRHSLRGAVQAMRTARDAARDAAYESADATTKATVDAALKIV